MQNLMIPTKEMLIEKYQLYPIKKYGSIATITDYAILNGGYSTKQNEGTYFLNNIESQGEYRPYFVSYLDETGKIKSTYCPKGVKAFYVEKFSHYSGENEMILQRGYTYRITAAKRVNGQILLDAEVILDSDSTKWDHNQLVDIASKYISG